MKTVTHSTVVSPLVMDADRLFVQKIFFVTTKALCEWRRRSTAASRIGNVCGEAVAVLAGHGAVWVIEVRDGNTGAQAHTQDKQSRQQGS